MNSGALVRFESTHTRGRYFTGRVVWATKELALVRDHRDNQRWRPSVVQLARLEYIKPTGRYV